MSFARLSTAALLALSLVSAANAAEPTFYLGGSLGTTNNSIDFSGAPNSDTSDMGYKLTTGIELNKNLAIELAYAKLGEASASGNNINGTFGSIALKNEVVELSGVGTLPIADKLSATGRLGVYSATVKGVATGFIATNGQYGTGKETSSGLVLGLGVKYNIAKKVSLVGEVTRYNRINSGIDNEKYDIDLFSVGVQYRF